MTKLEVEKHKRHGIKKTTVWEQNLRNKPTKGNDADTAASGVTVVSTRHPRALLQTIDLGSER